MASFIPSMITPSAWIAVGRWILDVEFVRDRTLERVSVSILANAEHHLTTDPLDVESHEGPGRHVDHRIGIALRSAVARVHHLRRSQPARAHGPHRTV